MLTFLWLATAVFGGCIITCIVNHTQSVFALRGLAVTALLPCTIVVTHWMLRKNMSGFKWWLVGAAFSGFLSTFIFQRSVEVAMLAKGVVGEDAVGAIMSGPIYWITRLNPVLNAPAKGWYLSCPIWFCAGVPLFMAAFAMLTSTSGRSAAVCSLAAAALILIGGKKQKTISRICRYFWVLIVVAVFGVFGIKNLYRYAAINDWLGEEVRAKYERQTKGKTGMMALLLGGRMESFCGLTACVDRPIVGFGPWPVDTGGYAMKFLQKFGDDEDVEAYYSRLQKNLQLGLQSRIPCHAFITEFWCWYGIFGLIFWLYVLFVLARFLKQDCWALPQWYMWLAAGVPGCCWGIFFSPWTKRIDVILFLVACLMARAVRKGRMQLPVEMQMEIMKNERK